MIKFDKTEMRITPRLAVKTLFAAVMTDVVDPANEKYMLDFFAGLGINDKKITRIEMDKIRDHGSRILESLAAGKGNGVLEKGFGLLQ